MKIKTVLTALKIKFNKFNDRLADGLSYSLSIMITFYIISFLVLIPLLYAHPTSMVAWASYLCSVIFQGIALPILGYTSRKAGDKTDTAINHILALTKRIEHIVKIIEKDQKEIDGNIDEILEKITDDDEEIKI